MKDTKRNKALRVYDYNFEKEKIYIAGLRENGPLQDVVLRQVVTYQKRRAFAGRILGIGILSSRKNCE